MQLLLVRHGDPDYANDALTEKGHRQAERLGAALEGVRIDTLYCSPMGRARLTAGYVARAKEMEPVVLPWLHELNGNYAGQLWAWNTHGCDTFRDLPPLSPADWHRHVPYGEHMTRIAAPFYKEFDGLMAEHGLVRDGWLYRIAEGFQPDVTLGFFCHGGVTLTLLAHLLHVPLPACYSQFACDPSSRTVLSLETKDGFGIFRLTSLNAMSHAANLQEPVQQSGKWESV